MIPYSEFVTRVHSIHFERFQVTGRGRMRCLLFGALLFVPPSACGRESPTSPSQTALTTPCVGGQATAPVTALTIAGPVAVLTGSIVKYKATATLANCGTIYNAQAIWNASSSSIHWNETL